ncbi:MAG: ABC transporter substrate-binding protein [Acidilobaceae archaeon]
MLRRLVILALIAIILTGVFTPKIFAQKPTAEETGLVLVSFEEGVDFMTEAAKYSIAHEIKWYGTDGLALSTKLLESATARDLAIKTNFRATIALSLENLELVRKVYWEVKDRVGYAPESYSFNTYDAVWVIGLAVVAAGGATDAEVSTIAELIPKIVEIYYGASGKIVLDENGDRVGSDYGIFGIVEKEGNYMWVLKEMWSMERDSITKYETDPLTTRPTGSPMPTVDVAKLRQLVVKEPPAVVTVTIGALYPLTGGLASFGRTNVEALKIAIEDLNKWLEANGFKFRFSYEIRDTATSPEVALDRFRELYARGIRVFVGPMASRELAKIRDEILGGSRAVVISPSSTSPLLKTKDTIFRFPPPDDYQCLAIARMIKNDGVKQIVIVYLNDDWGRMLADYTKRRAEELGITVLGMYAYDPNNPGFPSLAETVFKTIEANVAGPGVSPAIIVALVVIVAIVIVGGYLVLKKRK